jgi:hypothetical protein
LHQLPSQRPRPAADVQHPLASPHIGQFRELHTQRPGKTAHEPSVGICADVKHHQARVGRHAGTPGRHYITVRL